MGIRTIGARLAFHHAPAIASSASRHFLKACHPPESMQRVIAMAHPHGTLAAAVGTSR
jgi:hypothetical protein